ncbi:MAG: MYXO-CTERM sorting domain-containing protein, partial [Anaerolineales bacterium]
MSFYAVVPIPQNSDLYPALPIARESASPGLYSTQDLTVMSGLRGPFHVYRIIGGALYARGANVDLVWHGLFLAFLLLTFVTLWLLAWEVGRNAMAASIVTALIAAMHPFRGSLNWSWVPLSGFVSAMAAMPFALLAFVLLLRRRHNWALWLASATFIIHPYIGLIAVFACSGVPLFDARGVPGRVRAAWFAVAALIALPNAVTILVNLPQNFAGNIGGELYGQFRVHMYHAFVEDHWREGYGWFFLALAATTFFAPQLRRAVRRPVTIIIIALLTLAALYLFNLYVVRYYALMLTLLFRVTYFLKPLMAAVIVVGAWRWLPALRAQAAVDLPLTALLQRVAARRSGRIRFAPVEGYLALALLSLSAVIPPVPVAEALALLACALLLLTTGRARGLAAGLVGVGAVELLFAVAPRSAPALTPPDAWWDIAVGINVMAGLALAVVFWRMPPPIQVERAGAHTLPGIWRNLATAGAVCMASVMV